jgi:D-alanine transaminase
MMNEMFDDVVSAYINGEFVAPEDARISAFDRGLIFGDGIYEVVPIYGGQTFRWDEHLTRLNNNLNVVGIRQPCTRQQWAKLIVGLLSRATEQDHYLYIQVTRGVAPRNHVFPDSAEPTVFAYVQKMGPVAPSALTQGVTVVTIPDFRWHRCDIKTTSLIANVWLRQQAKEQGAAEAVLVRDGVVTEGAATNVFAVIDDIVRTAPQGPNLLPGITRDVVVELMDRAAVAYEERAFTEQQMIDAEEVWITSSTNEILPVNRINDKVVSEGRPGPVFQHVYDLFQQYKAQCRTDAKQNVG